MVELLLLVLMKKDVQVRVNVIDLDPIFQGVMQRQINVFANRELVGCIVNDVSQVFGVYTRSLKEMLVVFVSLILVWLLVF